jgi:hypothetical protein
VQEEALKAFVAITLPRSTRQVGAFIGQEFGLVYDSRSGLIALLHALLTCAQPQRQHKSQTKVEPAEDYYHGFSGGSPKLSGQPLRRLDEVILTTLKVRA